MLTLLLLVLGCAPSILDADLDGDGVIGEADCDDADATRYPEAVDYAGDEVDRNCDGVDGPDADQDGYADAAWGGDDCDDTRADVHPYAVDDPDDDLQADCGVDGDGDGDDDGYLALDVGGDDCADADPDIHPGAREHCDGVDEDCDGAIDEGAFDADRYYEDLDGDGFGSSASVEACAIAPGQATNDADCDDTDAAVNPDGVDLCGDGVDGDCAANEPACGIWEDGDVDDALVVFRGAVAVAGIGRLLGGGRDYTGDGAADVVVGVPRTTDGETTVAIFAGPHPASADVDSAEGRILQADMPDGRADDLLVVAAPDLTGDGEPDVFLGNVSVGDSNEGQAALYSGPFTGTRRTDEPDASVIPVAGSREQLGGYFAAPGDLTGDGVDDFVVTTDHYGTQTHVFAGPLTGEVGTADAFGHIAGDTGDGVGLGLDGADIDGDGVADLLAGTDDHTPLLFLGPVQGELTEADADAAFMGAAGEELYAPRPSADQDRDGYAEVIVSLTGARTGDALLLFDGPFAGTVAGTSAAAEIEEEDSDDGLGATVVSLDLDGDGRADLVAGAYGHDIVGDDNVGGAFVYYGPVSGRIPLLDADVVLRGVADDDAVGCGAASAGDLDADGAGDLLVGGGCNAWFAADAPGLAMLWYGGPGT